MHQRYLAATVLLGFASGLFWLIAAIVPLHRPKWKDKPWLVFGLNALAASLTSASILTGIDNGWASAFHTHARPAQTQKPDSSLPRTVRKAGKS